MSVTKGDIDDVLQMSQVLRRSDTGHIPLAYVMGYDTRPLLTLEEKKLFLDTAADEEWVLFLEHDAVNAACTVQHTEKGVRLRDAAPSWNELMG